MIGENFDPTSIVIAESHVQAFLQCGTQIIKYESDKGVSTNYCFGR